MLTRLILFLFGKPQKDAQTLLQDEVLFLRDQNQSLLKTIEGFQKPKLKVTPSEEFKPKKFDEHSKRFIPKTDEEIYQDLQGLKELNIL